MFIGRFPNGRYFLGDDSVEGFPDEVFAVESHGLEEYSFVVEAEEILCSISWDESWEIDVVLVDSFVGFRLEKVTCVFLISPDVGKVELIRICGVISMNEIERCTKDISDLIDWSKNGS